MDDGAQPAGGPRRGPQILDAAEGKWAEEFPPNEKPQFRCILHGLGSSIEPGRWDRSADEAPA